MQDKLHGAALDRKLGIMKRPSRTDEQFEEYLDEAKKAAKFNDEHAHAHVWNHMTSKGIAHDKKAMHAELDKAKTDTSHPLHTSNLKSGWVGKNKDKDHNHAHNELKTAVHTVHKMMQHDDFQKSAKAGHKNSLHNVKDGYKYGIVTKDEYENTLLAYHKVHDEMKSENRDKIQAVLTSS